MRRRCLSLWFPHFPIERARLRARRCNLPFPAESEPIALWHQQGNAERLVAVNGVARRFGVGVGMTLSDARAILPQLRLLPHDAEADARALEAIGHWCRRFTPLPALDPPDGVILDITGCAHLFGGELALCEEITRRLQSLGFTVRAGIADGRLAARAWTRYGEGGVLAADRRDAALRALPLAALGLAPETTATLLRLGFRRLGELAELPRASLLRRFGPELAAGLDTLFGDAGEPFVPLLEPPAFSARLGFAEPIGRQEDVEAALDRLLADLETALARAEQGARRLLLRLLRLDGEVVSVSLSLGQPMRRACDLAPLFRLRLAHLDAGFGFEMAILDAIETAPLPARQTSLLRRHADDTLLRFLEGLRQRLGPERVLRLEPVATYIPERAMRTRDAMQPVERADWLVPRPRPLALLPAPRPIAAIAPVPDGPPLAIREQGRLRHLRQARGPERILPEWWRDGEGRLRDFYEVVDATGARLWLCREGMFDDPEPPLWHLFGTFD